MKGGKAMPAKVSVDADAQTATFAFDKPLAPGSYTLSTDYTGVINTQANGLFALDYQTDSGKKRALYTQFENSDARRFIPSWDEPNYKATFDLRRECAGRADGGQQHAGRQRRRTTGDGMQAGGVRDLAEDVDLSAVPRHGRVRPRHD